MSEQAKPNLLIVDDDEDIVRMLCTYLDSHGFNCQVAHSGAQGVLEFALGEVDLVITDLNMPAGDGLALIDRIRRTSNVPIIVITAFMREYGHHHHQLQKVIKIQKPFSCDDLLDTIQLALSRVQAA